MKYVYFLKYNNYANRIFKRESSVTSYLNNSYGNDYIRLITDCTMWNPNDGITTSITTPNNTDFSIEPDYLIAADEYYNIDSRWFITETVRDRKGQYTCYLKRDVFADAWDEFKKSICNIDRAILSKYSPLVFNPEPISVNQIIKKETLLKDKTGCPWIVFYGEDVPSSVTVQPNPDTYAFSVADHEQWLEDNTFNYLPNGTASMQVTLGWQYANNSSTKGRLDLFEGGCAASTDAYLDDHSYTVNNYTPILERPGSVDQADIYVKFIQFRDIYSALTTWKMDSEYSKLSALNGKILYDSTAQKFYRLSLNVVANARMASHLNYPSAASVLAACQGALSATNIPANQPSPYTPPTGSNFLITYESNKVTPVLTEVPIAAGAYTANVPASGYTPSDSPYNMWCMPYGAISMTYNGTTVVSDPYLNLRVAMAFSVANSSNKVYDFQILPFCPLPGEVIQADGSISTDDSKFTDADTIKDSNNTTAGYIFACPNSTFSTQILLDSAITVDNPKLDNIINMYRLYSPNYASSFEFSVAKNGGLTGFNVRCTYMPINPYIRVSPIWGGIYGSSTFDKDPRGLICTGDYSMARVADAWVNYQEQNKNFEAIFNRQIDNMDVMRGYERIEQGVGIGVGALAGGAIGGKAFGPYGGAIGMAGSLISGVADYAISEGKFEESKSYATDLHKLQLGNVQAMPHTLARTTAFNIDNRYFPVFTEYSCTEEELNNVVSFIAARSMNVGTIGTPVSYISNSWSSSGVSDKGFIQGSIIRINSTHDTHYVDELNKEFQKGVYMR